MSSDRCQGAPSDNPLIDPANKFYYVTDMSDHSLNDEEVPTMGNMGPPKVPDIPQPVPPPAANSGNTEVAAEKGVAEQSSGSGKKRRVEEPEDSGSTASKAHDDCHLVLRRTVSQSMSEVE